MAKKVKIAVGQIFIKIDQEEENLARVLASIDSASEKGSDIIAFPECTNNGYVFRSVDHAYENATPIPGPFTDNICRKAKEKQIYVVIGLSERGTYPEIFNSAVVIDRKGEIIGKYQKHYLATGDKIWFKPSKTGFPVFTTEWGNIGIFICADGRMFENPRCLALAGADILFDVTNWIHPNQVLVNTPARAVENGVWLVAANKVGYECPKEDSWMPACIGMSFIMNPKGEIISQASDKKEEIIYGEIFPEEARNKDVSQRNHLFRDRRPETYKALLDPVAGLSISSLSKDPIIAENFCIQGTAIQISDQGEADKRMNRILSRVERASFLMSDIIVLPEMFNLQKRLPPNAVGDFAQTVPGPITDKLSEIARKYENYIAGSLLEREEGVFFNTAFLVGPEGYLGKYRKIHLWDDEKDYLKEGNLGYPIFKTKFGNLGIMIGYDGFFPEVARILTLRGADLIAWPSSWDREAYASFICPVRSTENRIFIITANKVGPGFIGQSMITDPGGNLLSRGSRDEERFVRAKMDLYNSRNKKLFANTSVIFEREPEEYQILCRP